jgi:alpha-glucosidase (family GH31 glycosyl hydrolase)
VEIVGGGQSNVINPNYSYVQFTNSKTSINYEVWKIGTSKEDLETYLSRLLGNTQTIPYWSDEIKSIYRQSTGDAIRLVFNLSNADITENDVLVSDVLANTIVNVTTNRLEG